MRKDRSDFLFLMNKQQNEQQPEWRIVAGPYNLTSALDIMHLANALRDSRRLNREIELRTSTESGEKNAIDLWCRYSVRRAKTSKEMCFILEAGKAIKRIIEAGGIPKIRADKGFIFVSGEFFECPDFRESLQG